MKPDKFKQYLQAFRKKQIQDQSWVVQNVVIRKFGGGRGREIKSLHLLFVDSNWRPGATIRPAAWLSHVVNTWNSGIISVTIDEGLNVSEAPCGWQLDVSSVAIVVKGSTLKVTGRMVEME